MILCGPLHTSKGGLRGASARKASCCRSAVAARLLTVRARLPRSALARVKAPQEQGAEHKSRETRPRAWEGAGAGSPGEVIGDERTGAGAGGLALVPDPAGEWAYRRALAREAYARGYEEAWEAGRRALLEELAAEQRAQASVIGPVLAGPDREALDERRFGPGGRAAFGDAAAG